MTQTLAEAKAHVQANIQEGLYCPVCGKWAKAYERTLCDRTVSYVKMLKSLENETDPVKANAAFIDRFGLKSGGEYGVIFRLWDFGRKTSPGIWKLTDKGRLFLQGDIQVPRSVVEFDGKPMYWSDELVSIWTVKLDSLPVSKNEDF